MFEANVLEFPFTAELPKREKCKVAQVWDRFQELSRITEREGMLIPMAYAAAVLDVSRQRVYQLEQSGKLKVIEVDGQKFVTENSVIEYARGERKAGRPMKVLDGRSPSLRECVKVAMQMCREVKAKKV